MRQNPFPNENPDEVRRRRRIRKKDF